MSALHANPLSGHEAYEATKLAVKERAFWPKMNREIYNYVKSCAPCAKARHQTNQHAGSFKSQQFVNKMEVFGIDLVGPFNEIDGQRWVLHGLCWTTGFNFVITLPNKKAETIAKALFFDVFFKYGFPVKLYSDRGGEFVNGVLKELTRLHDIRQQLTTPYHPQGNAKTENRHRYYNYILKILCNEYAMTWTMAIHFANWCLNTRPYHGTKYSPYELMFGIKARQPADFALMTDTDFDNKTKLSDEELFRISDVYMRNMAASVDAAIIESQRANRLDADRVRYIISYEPGALVHVHVPRLKKGVTTRLRYQTIGPFEVLEHNSPPNPDGSYNVYRLRHLGTGNEDTYNVKQILPYISRVAHEKAILDKPSTTPVQANVDFDPKPGAFILLPNCGGKAYQLLKVLHRDNDSVTAHYVNTTDKQRLRNFKFCWQHPTDLEIQSNFAITKKGYTKWSDEFLTSEFCQIEIPVRKDALGFHLLRKDVLNTLSYAPL
jgi:transposase InsO family protein